MRTPFLSQLPLAVEVNSKKANLRAESLVWPTFICCWILSRVGRRGVESKVKVELPQLQSLIADSYCRLAAGHGDAGTRMQVALDVAVGLGVSLMTRETGLGLRRQQKVLGRWEKETRTTRRRGRPFMRTYGP